MPKKNPPNHQDKSNQLRAILAEYGTLREEIRLFRSQHQILLQAFLGVVTLLVGAYFAKPEGVNLDVIALVIPSLVFLFYLLQVSSFYQAAAQGKASARIESRVNALFGTTLMDWDSFVTPQLTRTNLSPARWSLTAIGILLVWVFWYFTRAACKAFGETWLTIGAVEFGIMLLVTVLWIYFDLKVHIKG